MISAGRKAISARRKAMSAGGKGIATRLKMTIVRFGRTVSYCGFSMRLINRKIDGGSVAHSAGCRIFSSTFPGAHAPGFMLSCAPRTGLFVCSALWAVVCSALMRAGMPALRDEAPYSILSFRREIFRARDCSASMWF
jgi:hypothetical protein